MYAMGRRKLGTVRFTAHLLPRQIDTLKALAAAEGVSESQALRNLLDRISNAQA
jgi:hypothetical protein